MVQQNAFCTLEMSLFSRTTSPYSHRVGAVTRFSFGSAKLSFAGAIGGDHSNVGKIAVFDALGLSRLAYEGTSDRENFWLDTAQVPAARVRSSTRRNTHRAGAGLPDHLVDPLVSRHHSKVKIDGTKATIEDLGSRNGSRVNGRLIRGFHHLKDGDRIRIGTQELVFSEVEAVQLANKQTGFLCHCAGCRLPYPEEMGSCPNCGSNAVEEDNTLSGILDDRGRQNWALQMLIEMLKKALGLSRTSTPIASCRTRSSTSTSA